MEDRGHSHCDVCFSTSCSSYLGCSITQCSQCGISIHSCKMEDHEYHMCVESLVSCTNAQHGCEAMVKRKHLCSHMSVCPVMVDQIKPSETVKCEHCSVSVMESDMQDHNKVCLELEVDCINRCNGCRLRMKRKNLNTHMEHCPASVLTCQYYHWLSNTNHIGVQNILHESYQPTRVDEKFFLSQQDKETGGTLPGQKPRICNHFVCKEHMRRDEFLDHWNSHLHFVEDLPMIVRRCPLFLYGCTHSVVHYQPAPKGSILDFNPGIPSFVIRPPLSASLEDNTLDSGGWYANELAKKQELLAYGYDEDVNGSMDVLGQLPVEVIFLIMGHCDSLDLWGMSQVNRYFRGLCQEFVMERGVVIDKWEKFGKSWKTTTRV